MINPNMVSAELVRLVSSIINSSPDASMPIFGGDGSYYNGVTSNIRYYMNDDVFYFDVNYKHINFTISFPMFNDCWKWTIDDFSKFKMLPEIYKKLDYYGYATWD